MRLLRLLFQVLLLPAILGVAAELMLRDLWLGRDNDGEQR